MSGFTVARAASCELAVLETELKRRGEDTRGSERALRTRLISILEQDIVAHADALLEAEKANKRLRARERSEAKRREDVREAKRARREEGEREREKARLLHPPAALASAAPPLAARPLLLAAPALLAAPHSPAPAPSCLAAGSSAVVSPPGGPAVVGGESTLYAVGCFTTPYANTSAFARFEPLLGGGGRWVDLPPLPQAHYRFAAGALNGLVYAVANSEMRKQRYGAPNCVRYNVSTRLIRRQGLGRGETFAVYSRLRLQRP